MTRWPALLALALAAAASAQPVRIVSPANDTIVRPGPAAVSGTGPPGGTVTVTVDGLTHTATVSAAGTWLVPAVTVPPDIEVWWASDADSADGVLVTPGPDLPASPRPAQEVFFDWAPGVDDTLRVLANGTLSTPLTAAQEPAFFAGVRIQTEAAFALAYTDVDVKIVTAAGPGVQTIHLIAAVAAGMEFGSAPKVDFGNAKPTESCSVWVGTFADRMVNEFAYWGPMAMTDTWQTRLRDVGEALGRTAAHELGHSLGLVMSNSGYTGDWMKGNQDHNAQGVDNTFSRADRFDRGWYLMDPGQETLLRARLAEPDSAARAAVRQPARLNAFNRSYLKFIHP